MSSTGSKRSRQGSIDNSQHSVSESNPTVSSISGGSGSLGPSLEYAQSPAPAAGVGGSLPRRPSHDQLAALTANLKRIATGGHLPSAGPPPLVSQPGGAQPQQQQQQQQQPSGLGGLCPVMNVNDGHQRGGNGGGGNRDGSRTPVPSTTRTHARSSSSSSSASSSNHRRPKPQQPPSSSSKQQQQGHLTNNRGGATSSLASGPALPQLQATTAAPHGPHGRTDKVTLYTHHGGVLGPQAVQLVQSSFEALKPVAEPFVASFYDCLFDRHPELRVHFRHSDMKRQHASLISALVVVIQVGGQLGNQAKPTPSASLIALHANPFTNQRQTKNDRDWTNWRIFGGGGTTKSTKIVTIPGAAGPQLPPPPPPPAGPPALLLRRAAG